MEFDDPGGAQWTENDGRPSIHDLQLIRISTGESAYLLAVVKVNAFGHDLDLLPSNEVIGVSSRIVNTDDTIAQECASDQLQRLPGVLASVRRDVEELSLHIRGFWAAETLHIREADLTRAWAAISIRGFCPSRETGLSWSVELQGDNFNLQPVLAWKTLVVQLCQVGGDASVGNGRTGRRLRFRELVEIPVAFADAYSDILGNRRRLLFRGRSATVVGRMCMSIPTAVCFDSPSDSANDDSMWVDERASSNEKIDYEFLSRPSPVATQAFV